MTTSSTYGRQVVVAATNKSGGGVIKGDVVVIDTANNLAFTTNTAGAFTGTVAVAEETIASNAIGRILLSGYASLVNTSASVTRGNFGKTHTVVKQAVDAGASRVAGTFCQFLTGGTTPDAVVYPADLAAAALTDPMTTRGDIIVRNSSNTTARLAIGSNGKVLQSDGTDISWQTPSSSALAAAVTVIASGGNYTTTSSTYADIDGTNLSKSITTGAHRVKVTLTATMNHSSTANACDIDVLVDGTGLGGNGVWFFRPVRNSENYTVTYTWVSAALTAASHTVKLQWKTDGGTMTMLRSTSDLPITFLVEELPI